MSGRKMNPSLERARKSRTDHAIAGQGGVANQRPGRHYFTIDAGCLPPNTVRWYADHAWNRGYHGSGCDGTCSTPEECLARSEESPEYVVGQPSAVIMWCDEETYQFWVADRHDYVRCEGAYDGKDGRPYGLRTWKQTQRSRNLPSRSFLESIDGRRAR